MLHPSPEEEKRRHKKKRLVQSPNSYFMDVKCPGMVFLQLTLGGMGLCRFHSSTLIERQMSVLQLHILSIFFRLLQDHNSVQPCSDSCAVCWLFNGPVSAHWRQSTSHRGSVFSHKIYFIALLNTHYFLIQALSEDVLGVDFFLAKNDILLIILHITFKWFM